MRSYKSDPLTEWYVLSEVYNVFDMIIDEVNEHNDTMIIELNIACTTL